VIPAAVFYGGKINGGKFKIEDGELFGCIIIPEHNLQRCLFQQIVINSNEKPIVTLISFNSGIRCKFSFVHYKDFEKAQHFV
jgi:hypothetical protein